VASFTVQLDQAAIDRELRGRDGSVGRVMAGFAGLATQAVHDEERARAGGAWWPASSNISGTVLQVTVKATRAHVIVPRNAKVLVFQVNGATVFTRHVNHPGSSPPARIVEAGIMRAGSNFSVLGAV
jgi:hypothetical protein